MIFLLETLLAVFSYPRKLLKKWHLLNIGFVCCSIITLYIHFLNDNFGILHPILKSLMVSAQIFRFFLIMKHVKFIKKFLVRFYTIIKKAFPIIILFFMILFFYGLVGVQLFAYIFKASKIC